MKDMVQFTVLIDRKTWEEFVKTVQRPKTLKDAVADLIREKVKK
jgi:hypothetical protein